MDTKYDLEERLVEFAVRIIRVAESMNRSQASRQIAAQILSSGTSPYGHHGEAESAESRDDFVHKLKVCLKELRETRRWLRLIKRASLVAKPERLDSIIGEADELIRIFVASVHTAETNRVTRKPHLGVRRSAFDVQRSAPPARPAPSAS